MAATRIPLAHQTITYRAADDTDKVLSVENSAGVEVFYITGAGAVWIAGNVSYLSATDR